MCGSGGGGGGGGGGRGGGYTLTPVSISLTFNKEMCFKGCSQMVFGLCQQCYKNVNKTTTKKGFGAITLRRL